MTYKPFSIRMAPETHRLLEDRSRRHRQPKARLAERLIEEGLRMELHPGVVFRDGPAGRRAGLVCGPDVWEVIETLMDTGLTDAAAVAQTAEWGGLDPSQVRTAISYYGEHREEIDDWIAANRAEAQRARAAWERGRSALA